MFVLYNLKRNKHDTPTQQTSKLTEIFIHFNKRLIKCYMLFKILVVSNFNCSYHCVDMFE